MEPLPGRSPDDPTRDDLPLGQRFAGRPWLVEIGSPEGGFSQLLQPGERVLIGSGAAAQLRVSDPTVSHRHCALRVLPDRIEITDLESKNGLHVGSVRVPSASVAGPVGAFVIGRTTVVLRAEWSEEPADADPIPGLIGGSAGMRRVAAEIRRYARSRAPVLLQGESGTGKDVVARALHQLSRRTGAYVPLNVGALPESLADAELFGHRRGAFTGAVQSRVGAFEHAHQGTLFLDEIADLSHAVQVKLLRVVEDGAIRPLGGSSATTVDVRVISATWADLEQRVAEEKFRADLYHRLSTVVVRIPPLRQRKSDIPELCRVLLGKIRGEVGEKQLTSGALSALVDYDWPGNVRELGSVLYRASMASADPLILPQHIKTKAGPGPSRLRRTEGYGPERARILLRDHAGNVSAAARAAGVARSTFRAWLLRTGETETREAASELAGDG